MRKIIALSISTAILITIISITLAEPTTTITAEVSTITLSVSAEPMYIFFGWMQPGETSSPISVEVWNSATGGGQRPQDYYIRASQFKSDSIEWSYSGTQTPGDDICALELDILGSKLYVNTNDQEAPSPDTVVGAEAKMTYNFKLFMPLTISQWDSSMTATITITAVAQ